MDFGADKNVLNISDQYMFGTNLMICPVSNYKERTREVYFPQGSGWYNLYNGSFVAGGQKQIVDAPYERMPIFVKAGSILPMGEVIQNTTEAQTNLTLYVYAGKNGKFTLYEDENVNYNYEKGAFSAIDFTYNDANKTLSVGSRKGNFKGMVKERAFKVVLIEQGKSIGIDGDVLGNAKLVHYNGAEVTTRL